MAVDFGLLLDSGICLQIGSALESQEKRGKRHRGSCILIRHRVQSPRLLWRSRVAFNVRSKVLWEFSAEPIQGTALFCAVGILWFCLL